MSGGNVNSPPLTISNIQTTDAGNYVCEATDGATTVRTNDITVSVKGLSLHFRSLLRLLKRQTRA